MKQHPPEIAAFLASGSFAVVGASADRAKYGNKVLRCYLQHGLPVVAINPHETEIEGVACAARLADAPGRPRAVSIITPPAVTDAIVDQALELGIEHLWMQPGAESEAAIARARARGANVIAHGPCVLVVLGFRDE